MVLPGEGDKLRSTKGPWDGAAVTGQWTRSLPGVLGEAKEARAQGMEGSSVWAVESQTGGRSARVAVYPQDSRNEG